MRPTFYNQSVTAGYSCADEAGGSGRASCVGSVPNGSRIDTSTVGEHSFTVTATDNAGNTKTLTVHYTVPPPTKVSLSVWGKVYVQKLGVVNVTVYSTNTFDATTIDVGSVCFGDAGESGQRDCTERDGQAMRMDANLDRRPDLALQFETQQTGIDAGDTSACLTGNTGREAIEGCTRILTFPGIPLR